jgi:hypothetical protein
MVGRVKQVRLQTRARKPSETLSIAAFNRACAAPGEVVMWTVPYIQPKEMCMALAATVHPSSVEHRASLSHDGFQVKADSVAERPVLRSTTQLLLP